MFEHVAEMPNLPAVDVEPVAEMPNPPAVDVEPVAEMPNLPTVDVIELNDDDIQQPIDAGQNHAPEIIIISDYEPDFNEEDEPVLEPHEEEEQELIPNYEADGYEADMEFGESDDDVPINSPNTELTPGEVINEEREPTVDSPSSSTFRDVVPRWIPPLPARFCMKLSDFEMMKSTPTPVTRPTL